MRKSRKREEDSVWLDPLLPMDPNRGTYKLLDVDPAPGSVLSDS